MLDRIEPVATLGLLQQDDVIPWLYERRRAGHRAGLVTVVGVEGGSPRSAGAQMAVSETGDYIGYLSGGCMEQAVAAEALIVIREGRNRLVRYGKDSKYMDIRLPCGAGLDVYFDQSLDYEVIAQLVEARQRRVLMALKTDLQSGKSQACELATPNSIAPASVRKSDSFTRIYVPPLKLQLIGIGPAVAAIARMAANVGIEIDAASPDKNTRAELLFAGLCPHEMTTPALPSAFRADDWTAAVLAFHEHQWEPPIIAELLQSNCFYIGAVGSRRVHANRLNDLAAWNLADSDLARIHAPIGLIPGAKGRTTLAFGVVAEVLAEAKARQFIS